MSIESKAKEAKCQTSNSPCISGLNSGKQNDATRARPCSLESSMPTSLDLLKASPGGGAIIRLFSFTASDAAGWGKSRNASKIGKTLLSLCAGAVDPAIETLSIDGTLVNVAIVFGLPFIRQCCRILERWRRGGVVFPQDSRFPKTLTVSVELIFWILRHSFIC